MIEQAGVVILKKQEWGNPEVYVTLNRREKSIDMSFSKFMEILTKELTIKAEGILKPGIMTKKKIGVADKAINKEMASAIIIATTKILTEMRESVTQPMVK